MSTYVMSDIHGEYDKYRKMLETINFSDDDVLYILGDVIDRGDKPIMLLRDMSVRANIIPVAGNHEIMALDVLRSLLVEVTQDNYDSQITKELIEKMFEWQQNGGDITLRQFKELPIDVRISLFEYLEEFSPYEVVRVKDNTFILTHCGNISSEKPLSQHSIFELAFTRADFCKRVFDDSSIYCISGHTPTLALTNKPEIYKKNNNYNIDCGAVFGGRLACLRLDDFCEFYC